MSNSPPKSSSSLTGHKGEREYDLIVWGATGYTGRLAASYLASRDGVDLNSKKRFRWAIAGRDSHKLQELAAHLKKEHNLEHPIHTLQASLDNAPSLYYLASRTKTICSFVGPFTLMGEPLLEACIKMDTHYLDATAEIFWVEQMYNKYAADAYRHELKIVSFAGFDFVPNDLMMLQLLKEIKTHVPEWNNDLPLVVNHLFDQSTVWVSGGTARSGMYLVGSFPLSKAVEAYTDPYMVCRESLNQIPDETRRKNTYFLTPNYIAAARAYNTPFVMSSLMCKFMHWSNYKQDFPWGKKLHYRGGQARASLIAALWASILIWFQYTCLLVLRTFPSLSKFIVQPGSGPAINPKTAFMKSILVAQPFISDEIPSTKSIVINWYTRGIEPYTFAAIAMVEGALAIALQDACLPEAVGYLPPSAALGEALIKRLLCAGVEQKITVESHADATLQNEVGHKNVA